ncbi:MAG: hypothetical protein FIA95_05620 [Gemmatimonadetes bacterium]|nr:hypothetical protein [Gemmatimonadota bacterium]
MSDLLHLTYASEDNYHLHRLLASAEHQGIPVQVLGLGRPWAGFLQKLEAVRRALEGVAGDRIVVFTDAFDAVYLRPASALEERFLATGRPVVFGAAACFHAPGNEEIVARYPPSPTRYRYLNSGCYAGHAGALARILERVLDHPATDDDQALLSRYFVEHPDEIALDYSSELFVATSGRPYDGDLVVEGGGLLDTHTGSRPCVLHTPGKYFGVLEDYSSRLPFYRGVRWSRMSPRILAQVASGYLVFKVNRALKRLGA